MSVFTIVPVKPFAQSKSRLAEVLSSEERAGLSRAFLEHTLSVLMEVAEVTETLVISRDPAALAVARAFGARAVLETEPSDLNAALEHATEIAQQSGARAVLILPVDLPCANAEAIEAVIAEDDGGRRTDDGQPSTVNRHSLVTIAPDRHEAGTNALLVRPPGFIPYAFGADSFQQHCALAHRAGASLRIVRLPGLALDVDVPEDLMMYRGEEVQR
jgi:2-phospho-L-lactate guanylyltransferase